jgi:hypothetical protein
MDKSLSVEGRSKGNGDEQKPFLFFLEAPATPPSLWLTQFTGLTIYRVSFVFH